MCSVGLVIPQPPEASIRFIFRAIAMIAAVWGRLRRLLAGASTRERRKGSLARSRKVVPSVESLEAVALLSVGPSVLSSAALHLGHSNNHRLVSHIARPRFTDSVMMRTDPAPVELPEQTVTLGPTLTNFVNVPLSPVLSLFNPSLGTLKSVEVKHSASIQSLVTSQNLSASSPTVITASVAGSFEIDGLNQTISQPTTTLTSLPMPAGVFGSPTDTVAFPPFLIPNSSTSDFTDATSLAFFTASAGRPSVTLTMTATANASASAPNGNLLTTSDSSAMGSVTIGYTYVPVCPTVGGIGRIGIHHQPTQLVVTFDGPVDPTKAADPANYTVITLSGKLIPIKSATYNPATNSVTLIPERRLNVHHHFRLSVVLPCPNEVTGDTVIIPFGGRGSLIGFTNHHGKFISVKNGRIVRSSERGGQNLPTWDRPTSSGPLPVATFRPQVRHDRRG
jgi:hypothetical protein